MRNQEIQVRRAALVADPIANYPVATIAAFDPTIGELPRRQFDGARLNVLLTRYAQLRVPAVLIAASTGQGQLRTVAELEEWFRAAAACDTPQLAKIALLRPEDGLTANARLLDQLTELGYLAVFFRPGTDLLSDQPWSAQVTQLTPLVAAAAERNLPVGLYSISDVSGRPLPAEVATELVQSAAGRWIVAIKVTEADYAQSTQRFLSTPELSHLKIVQGWDPHLAQALRAGLQHDGPGRQRCGVTSGPMAFAVLQYQHVLAAADRQDWDEVAAAQQAVNTLFAAMQDDPHKFADLQRAKYVMGLGHPLVSSIQPAQTARLLDALAGLPRAADRARLAASLDLLADGPFHDALSALVAAAESPG